jgi:hypothetical protein
MLRFQGKICSHFGSFTRLVNHVCFTAPVLVLLETTGDIFHEYLRSGGLRCARLRTLLRFPVLGVPLQGLEYHQHPALLCGGKSGQCLVKGSPVSLLEGFENRSG